MTNVVVGFGRTGRSVARFFEERALSFWVADDHLDGKAKAELSALQYCKGVSTLAELSPVTGQTWIVSPGIPLTRPLFQRAQDQGVELINDLHLFEREVAGLLVGVTGSNGKSTVVAMIDHIAKSHQIRSIAAGNIGLPVLDTLGERPELTVIELSSYQLELDPVINLHVGALINLMPDHLDRYPSIDVYYKTKEKILGASDKVVCFDTWRVERAEQALEASTQDWLWVEQVRRGEDGSVGTKRVVEVIDAGQSYRFMHADAEGEIHKHGVWLSRHNSLNAASAISVSLCLGLPFESSLAALKSFTGLAHRCEVVDTGNGVTWVNDSKATNVGAAVSAIRSFGDGAPLILIAGGQAKQEDYGLLAGTLSEMASIKGVLLYGEAAGLISEQLGESFHQEVFEDLVNAIASAHAMSLHGDVVLFSPACSSFDQFQDFEARGNVFRRCVLELVA